MREYRERDQALLDRRTMSRVGGGSLQLVTVCLTDEDAGELCDEHGRPVPPAPPMLAHLRPSEARELAFCLLELGELALHRSELTR